VVKVHALSRSVTEIFLSDVESTTRCVYSQDLSPERYIHFMRYWGQVNLKAY
jgi:hypothetical protein